MMTTTKNRIISISILCMNILLLNWIPIQMKIHEHDFWHHIFPSRVSIPEFTMNIYHNYYFYEYYFVGFCVFIVIALVIKEFFITKVNHCILVNIITLFFLFVLAIINANSLLGLYRKY